MRLSARLVTLVCALALAAHASAPCAGWKPSAEARLDCCGSHCPMDEADAHHGSHGPVSQADADACCAISERSDAAPAAAAPPTTLVLLTSALSPPGHVSSRETWRTAAPVPTRTISTHLLLSVLLV